MPPIQHKLLYVLEHTSNIQNVLCKSTVIHSELQIYVYD